MILQLLHLLRQLARSIRKQSRKAFQLHREIAKLFWVDNRLSHDLIDSDFEAVLYGIYNEPLATSAAVAYRSGLNDGRLVRPSPAARG